MPSTSKNQETVLHNNGGPSRRKLLPPGWRFNPTDEELLLHFLRPKNNGQPCRPDIIHEVDLYSYCPDDLTRMHEPQGKNEWYFFTRRKQRYGSRPDRTAGNGFWKATGSNDAVRDGKKQSIIGFKRALSFFHGQQSDKNLNNKSCWLMHEYQLRAPEETEPSDRKGKRAPTIIKASTPGAQPESQGVKELWMTYLLCKVYPNGKKEGKNTTHEEHQEVEPILNTQRQDTSAIQQEQERQEVEPITADEPINTNSIVTSPPTLNRTHGLTTYALEDPQIHSNSQTGMIFRPISMYIDPRINILPGHCSSGQEQGAKGLDSYDALAINNGFQTSNLCELSAIFRNERQCNSFHDDLQVDHSPLNDLPPSSNSFSRTAFDELSAIFQGPGQRIKEKLMCLSLFDSIY